MRVILGDMEEYGALDWCGFENYFRLCCTIVEFGEDVNSGTVEFA
jgi:hypothetical protein